MRHLILLIYFGLIVACQESKIGGNEQASEPDNFLDSMKRAKKVEEMMEETYKRTFLDTTGVSTAPVKVLSAKLVKREYSSYKDIALTYKNVSGKRIEAIRFKWYGLNAFNEPADMGSSSLLKGFSGGQDHTSLAAGRTTTGTWEIMSADAKKITLAWPYEVAFSDGTVWKLKQ